MYTEFLLEAPTLQHLVKKIGNTPEETAKKIAASHSKKIPIQTWRAREYFAFVLQNQRDLGLKRAVELAAKKASVIKNPNLRQAALEVIPLAEKFCQEHDVPWARPMPPERIYLTDKVFTVVRAAGIARIDGETSIIWPQTWKKVSLDAFEFNLLMTVLAKRLLPSFPDAKDISWVEMSVPPGFAGRQLSVRDLSSAKILTDQELLDVSKNIEIALKILETARPGEFIRPIDDQMKFDL